jgi:uncharacterized protein YndB with AHSA1/START domain
VGRDFEIDQQIVVSATPEVIWDAIATGPGIDSWFMGHSEVVPGPGGTVRSVFGDYAPECTITSWQPGTRLAYRTDAEPDGRFIAYEFLIEGRDSGSTVIRMVTGGFLPGEDWEDEYDAMSKGLQLFLHTLAEYVTHFAGRTPVVVTVFSQDGRAWPAGWPALHEAIGLTAPAAIGQPVRFSPAGLPPIDGVVYLTNPDVVGVRANDALYRFLGGYGGPIVLAHQLFGHGIDPARTESAWQAWLAQTLGYR